MRACVCVQLYVSAFELDAPNPESLTLQMNQVDERYRPLVASVGLELFQKISSSRIFMVLYFTHVMYFFLLC